MKRAMLWLAVMVIASRAFAQDAADKPKADVANKPANEALKDNPEDVAALRKLYSESMTAVVRSMASDPDGALKRLSELEAAVEALQPQTPAAKQMLSTIKLTAKSYRQRIEVQRLSIDELEKQLAANPDDAKAMSDLFAKVQSVAMADSRERPEEAKKAIARLKQAFAAAGEKAKLPATKSQLEIHTREIDSLERRVEAGEKLVKLIGQDAAPLKVETWVNGAPLSDADLKGKVVFLDFWSIWCGPCIATFPHLKEWNAKYAEKGLVMIGLTRYYNYKWDDAAARPAAAGDKVSPQDEQAMLVKFAEHHGLKHRFAVQADSSLSEYYGVTGIPHVVVIDQQGKIRLMKVGSGEDNAKAIGELLDKLLGGATGGE